MITNGFLDLGDGRVALTGPALERWRRFDEQFMAMARERGAEEIQFPSLVTRPTLDRAGYLESFPDMACPVGENHLLMPAVCYQCYEHWSGQRLVAPQVVTCVGRCYRSEGGKFDVPGRLWEFTMREVVFVGPQLWVKEQRQEWMDRVSAFALSQGIEAQMEPATDPFFCDASRGKRLVQQMKELKYELRARSLALASFNLHEEHFTERFNISLAGGAAAHTGCVAFGLERWAWTAMGGVT